MRPKGPGAAFVLEADGMRPVHLGDLGHALTDEQLVESAA
jgi:Beta-lactamase superfamily domain